MDKTEFTVQTSYSHSDMNHMAVYKLINMDFNQLTPDILAQLSRKFVDVIVEKHGDEVVEKVAALLDVDAITERVVAAIVTDVKLRLMRGDTTEGG